MPKDKKEVVIPDKELALNEKDEEFPETPKIVDILTLKDVLELRAKSWHTMEVVLHQDINPYQEKLIGTLRATVPEGLRPPTINEARRCDREIMNEKLKAVAKGSSSDFELGEGGAQPEGFPGQGLEKEGSQQKGPTGVQPGRGRKREHDGQDEKAADETVGKPRVCKKRHEPRVRPRRDGRKLRRARRRLRRPPRPRRNPTLQRRGEGTAGSHRNWPAPGRMQLPPAE